MICKIIEKIGIPIRKKNPKSEMEIFIPTFLLIEHQWTQL